MPPPGATPVPSGSGRAGFGSRRRGENPRARHRPLASGRPIAARAGLRARGHRRRGHVPLCAVASTIRRVQRLLICNGLRPASLRFRGGPVWAANAAPCCGAPRSATGAVPAWAAIAAPCERTSRVSVSGQNSPGGPAPDSVQCTERASVSSGSDGRSAGRLARHAAIRPRSGRNPGQGRPVADVPGRVAAEDLAAIAPIDRFAPAARLIRQSAPRPGTTVSQSAMSATTAASTCCAGS